jgi:hypothetical protein
VLAAELPTSAGEQVFGSVTTSYLAFVIALSARHHFSFRRIGFRHCLDQPAQPKDRLPASPRSLVAEFARLIPGPEIL